MTVDIGSVVKNHEGKASVLVESSHEWMNCFYCAAINQNECYCDLTLYEPIYKPRRRVCTFFELRGHKESFPVDEQKVKALKLKEMLEEFIESLGV